MTTITTIEELRAVPVGSSVLIDTFPWTVEANGLLRSTRNPGVEVQIDYMGGTLAAGTVTTADPFQVGHLYSVHGGYRYVATIDTAGTEPQVGYVWMNADGYNFESYFLPLSDFRGTACSSPGWWSPGYQTLLTSYFNAWVASNQTPPAAPQVPHRLVEQLGDWGRSNGVDDEGLREILDDHDVPYRNEVSVSVSVDISGRTDVDFEDHHGVSGIEEMIHSGRLCDWDDRTQSEVTLTWSASHIFEIDANEGDCACGEVDRELVRQFLDDSNVTYCDFEFEASCENC